MKGARFISLLFLLSAFFGLLSCGGGGGGGSTSGGTGTLLLALTDSTSLDYKAVYVTIDRVDVHLGGNENSPNNWETIADSPKTYNLLELVNGVWEHLGIGQLPAGHYTQMRLIIGNQQDEGLNILDLPHLHPNYVILKDTDEIHPLKVPSGAKTGIKLVRGFTVEENETTELLLDFDAANSVVKAGASGLWILKPTIKVVDTKDCTVIAGTVREGETGVPGVSVSAQTIDPDPSVDRKHQVVTVTSTVTDENGQYKLFLEEGEYNIVAYGSGYNPQVKCLVAISSGEVLEDQDFTLSSANTETVSGNVSITDGAEDQHATISFRQMWDCDGDAGTEADIIEFEVTALNIANNTPYTIDLPEGLYDVVSGSYGKQTQIDEAVEVLTGDTTELNIAL